MENTLDPVTLVPPLIFDRKICEIELKGNEPPSFRFELNQAENELLIIPLYKLDCEQRQSYQFDLTISDCSEKKQRSNRSSFFLVVYDINEHVPVFDKSVYTFKVESGTSFSYVFEAHDADCGQTYSSVCGYNFVNQPTGLPFMFSSVSKGKLFSTKPLNYYDQEKYEFEISAIDCGNKISNFSKVIIIVEKPCKLGWRNIHDVTLESDHACLLPDAYFETCGHNCTSFSLESELAVNEGRCLLESAETTIQRCPGMGDNLLEPGFSAAANQIFTFYGTVTALEIPPIASIIPETYSFGMWLRHNKMVHENSEKESIICQTDSFTKNRHHFHFYLHNCNFGLTWRKPTSSRTTSRIETRSQFHWNTMQFCDNSWHFIVLNVDTHDTVQLFIDGQLQNVSTSKFSDPLMNTNDSVAWTIGACWHAKEASFVQHYEGKMGSLNYLPGKLQEPQPCQRKCLEYLDYLTTHSERIHVITERGGKPKQKLSGLENMDSSEFEGMIRNVHYINVAAYVENNFKRTVKIDSTAICVKESTNDIKKFHQFFNVTINSTDKSRLSIRSRSDIYSYSNVTLYRGVQLFPEVDFAMSASEKTRRVINSCKLFIYPPLKDINRKEGLSLAEVANLLMLKARLLILQLSVAT